MLEENGYFKDFGPLVAKLLAPQLLGISVAGGILTNNLIGAFKSALIRRNINGIDHLKENKPIV